MRHWDDIDLISASVFDLILFQSLKYAIHIELRGHSVDVLDINPKASDT
jgi:hypothetical protein